MDSEGGGLWRSFQSSKECLGLHALTMFDRSNRETFRWGLSVAGNDNGVYEVLLTEMPTKHNVFFGTKIPKGVSSACKAIKDTIKEK